MMLLRRRFFRGIPNRALVPDIVEWDPRAAEWDAADYRDVWAAAQPDADEPRSADDYFLGGRT